MTSWRTNWWWSFVLPSAVSWALSRWFGRLVERRRCACAVRPGKCACRPRPSAPPWRPHWPERQVRPCGPASAFPRTLAGRLARWGPTAPWQANRRRAQLHHGVQAGKGFAHLHAPPASPGGVRVNGGARDILGKQSLEANPAVQVARHEVDCDSLFAGPALFHGAGAWRATLELALSPTIGAARAMRW